MKSGTLSSPFSRVYLSRRLSPNVHATFMEVFCTHYKDVNRLVARAEARAIGGRPGSPLATHHSPLTFDSRESSILGHPRRIV